uniref:Uncharacterized protein n=1 Tax=Cacopsylla melanoneura TaxID=428564 RepID=A0A8D8T6U9_9HEMI
MYRRNHARLGAKAFGRKEMSICSTTQEQSRQRLRVFRQFWFFFVVIMVFLAYRNRDTGKEDTGQIEELPISGLISLDYCGQIEELPLPGIPLKRRASMINVSSKIQV